MFGLKHKALSTFGCFLLFTTALCVAWPEKSKDSLFFQVKAENIAQNEAPVLSPSQTAEDPGNFNLMESNSFMAVSSPENFHQRSLADVVAEESVKPQGKEITEYIAKKGDTYASIAKQFGIDTQTIYWANDITSRTPIKEGMSLIILPTDGLLHTVKSGDSIQKLAKTYKTEVQDIRDFNEISESDKLYPGDILIIPGGKMPAKAKPAPVIQYASDSFLPSDYFICPIPRTNGACQKTQGLHFLNAVDLSPGAASCGQPVYAAASGKVYKVKIGGYNGGFGNYAKILHPSGVTTLYAHLSRVNVQEGQEVANGEIIGAIGNTGRVIGFTGCHLHFEVGSINGPAPRNFLAR